VIGSKRKQGSFQIRPYKRAHKASVIQLKLRFPTRMLLLQLGRSKPGISTPPLKFGCSPQNLMSSPQGCYEHAKGIRGGPSTQSCILAEYRLNERRLKYKTYEQGHTCLAKSSLSSSPVLKKGSSGSLRCFRGQKTGNKKGLMLAWSIEQVSPLQSIEQNGGVKHVTMICER
jgi:hypothetical protein